MPTRSPGSSARPGAWRSRPRRCCSHGSASAGSSVAGVRSTGASTICASRSRRSACGQVEQRVVALGEQVERDEARRRGLGEHVDARLRRVDALAERVEVLPALGVEQHDLAVEHVAARRGTSARGSSARAAGRCATAGGPRRRRRTRSRGSRPTSARRPSRRRSAARGPSWRAAGARVGRAAAARTRDPSGVRVLVRFLNVESPVGRGALDDDGANESGPAHRSRAGSAPTARRERRSRP